LTEALRRRRQHRRYVGRINLEETILKTNPKRLGRLQLRLRNIGGIIIVDFIDMEKEENQRRVPRQPEEALSADRPKMTLHPISSWDWSATRKRAGRTRPASASRALLRWKGDRRALHDRRYGAGTRGARPSWILRSRSIPTWRSSLMKNAPE
jgi:hypothetical protein